VTTTDKRIPALEGKNSREREKYVHLQISKSHGWGRALLSATKLSGISLET